MPRTAPATASDSQCTCRYVRLQAIPAIDGGSGHPPPAPMPVRLREEENEDHSRRARIGGVTRGVGRAVRLDHRSRGPLSADD